jgi:hypothetical protein
MPRHRYSSYLHHCVLAYHRPNNNQTSNNNDSFAPSLPLVLPGSPPPDDSTEFSYRSSRTNGQDGRTGNSVSSPAHLKKIRSTPHILRSSQDFADELSVWSSLLYTKLRSVTYLGLQFLAQAIAGLQNLEELTASVFVRNNAIQEFRTWSSILFWLPVIDPEVFGQAELPPHIQRRR